MTIIKVYTSDKQIWNSVEVFSKISICMCKNISFVLDFQNEGPAISNLGVYEFVEKLALELNYRLANITIKTANILEKHHTIKIVYTPPMHLLNQLRGHISPGIKNKNFKHFGIFIGRSNPYRLHLASFLHKNYLNKTLLSYRFNLNDEFHMSNIGIESLMQALNSIDVRDETEFLSKCPLLLNDETNHIMDKLSTLNHAQQLLAQDHNDFINMYQDFFIEIVCETYYSDNTFFPTEKTFRPILLKTPFIVQGPRYYLDNLKKLGFKTFDKWWNEAYSEDPVNYQLVEIKNTINFLASKNTDELFTMYNDMQDVLEHNYNLALSLTAKDFYKINE
jgi:hypothetical protein